MKTLLLAALAAATAAAPAPAETHRAAPNAEEVRIPFVQFGGIRDFHADGPETLYLQDRRRNWYRAEMIGACINLPWARAIGIDSRGMSNLDRFSILVVEGERCAISSLTRSEGPPLRENKKKRG